MVEEQNPENKEPQQGALPEPAPVSTPTPAPTGAISTIPEWVRKRTATCQNPQCGTSMDPALAFTDPETGIKVCEACTRECENCNEKNYIGNMVSYKTPDDRWATPDWYCKDCYNEKFTTCPNCKAVVDKEIILLPTNRNRYSVKKGGCTFCCVNCDSCGKVVEKDYEYNYDGQSYCEDCYSEHFTTCEKCDATIGSDDAQYVESVGSICQSCYNEEFAECYECSTVIEKDKSSEIDEKYYCDNCYKQIAVKEYPQYTQNFTALNYTKKDRYLNLLNRLLPITVKDLKSKHSSIASGLNDLIVFSGGKPLTLDLVQQYRQSLNPEEFPIEYTVWVVFKDLQIN